MNAGKETQPVDTLEFHTEENIFADDIGKRPIGEDGEVPEKANVSDSTPSGRRRPNIGDLSWTDLRVPTQFHKALEKMGARSPSAIQKLAIPHMIRPFDSRLNKVYVPPTVAVQDYTGSGKTISYVLPILANVDTTVDKRIPPPHVIAVQNKLRGLQLPSPPALALDPTITDEYERAQVIMYGDDHTFEAPAEDDAAVDEWLDQELARFEQGGEREWAAHVQARALEAEASEGAPRGLAARLSPGGELDPSFALEAQRLRRKAKLLAKLRQVFPTLDESLLDPDNEQSRLQAIVVVPTKELATQITNVFRELNHTIYQLDKATSRSRREAGNHHVAPRLGKETVVVRMVAGQVGANMLQTLGVRVSARAHTGDGPQDFANKHDNKDLRKEHGVKAPPPALHPFVSFGKGHPLYRPDQDQIRANVLEDDKEAVLRKIQRRSRDQELARLARVEDGDPAAGRQEDYDDEYAAMREQLEQHRQHRERSAAVRSEAAQAKRDVARATDEYALAPSPLLYEQLGAGPGDTIEVTRRHQPHVLVGTPATITQLLKSGAIQLPSAGPAPSQLKYLVFDEIDHLARNDAAPDHRAVLELMSIPNDQTVFVSASMTRETALFMTRLARRHNLPALALNPRLSAYSGLLTLPRPAEEQLNDEQIDLAFAEAEAYAAEQWRQAEERLAQEGAPQVLNKRGELVATDPAEIVDRMRRRVIAKNSTPYLPAAMAAQLPFRGEHRGLPITVTGSALGEVLFLSPDDYRQNQLADASGALPLPPYLKHYYLRVPRHMSKEAVLLDILCQLKLKPARGVNPRLVNTSNRASRAAAEGVFLDAEQPADLSAVLVGSEEDVARRQAQPAAEPAPRFVSRTTLRIATAANVCPGNVIVFFSRSACPAARGVHRQLDTGGVRTGIFMQQATRQERAEALLKNRQMDVLLASDTLARGIDLPELSLVVNMDVPRSSTSYLHRAGRVGRMGTKHRRKAIVLNLIADQADKPDFQFNVKFRVPGDATDESLLRKHVRQLGLLMEPWPFKVEFNHHKGLLKAHQHAHATANRKAYLRERAERYAAGRPGIEVRGTKAMPNKKRLIRDVDKQKNRSDRPSSLADGNWMTWDSSSKKWQ
jgi:superfamily II DNA/RNA helicase